MEKVESLRRTVEIFVIEVRWKKEFFLRLEGAKKKVKFERKIVQSQFLRV